LRVKREPVVGLNRARLMLHKSPNHLDHCTL
jgi:hypothetical protein